MHIFNMEDLCAELELECDYDLITFYITDGHKDLTIRMETVHISSIYDMCNDLCDFFDISLQDVWEQLNKGVYNDK